MQQAHSTERQAKNKLCQELQCTPKHLRKAKKIANRKYKLKQIMDKQLTLLK